MLKLNIDIAYILLELQSTICLVIIMHDMSQISYRDWCLCPLCPLIFLLLSTETREWITLRFHQFNGFLTWNS
jgi:hypothetical protein